MLSCFASYDPLTWLATSYESTKTMISSIFIYFAMRNPTITASYSASLLVAVNLNFKAYVNFVPSGLTTIKPASKPSSLDAPSVYSFYLVVSSVCYFSLKSVSSSSSLVSARKSARIWALTAFLGLNSISCSPSSIAHLATLPDFLGFDNKSLIGLFVRTVMLCA
ncbi:hypothetical protein Tco_0307065 [Tanacetum coccineum]